MIFQKHAGVLFFPCLSGEDVWSYAKKLPHLFQQGGVFYNIVKKDMGKSPSVFIYLFIIKNHFLCTNHSLRLNFIGLRLILVSEAYQDIV